ncbi:glycosyltransferase [Effusibacillus consociatus]|uniref:Glycosyltransferase n=1 Tax=Effusibacillus consociatus TaxID=1117041 RepID=A0ABV9PVQ4_9BACL
MPIRVMHVVRPADGGMREHVKQLIWGMPHDQIEPIVACPEESALFCQLPSRVHKIALEVKDGVKPWEDMRSVIALRQQLERHPIDILHMHGAKSALIGRTAAALAKRKPRLICTVHNFIQPANRILRSTFVTIERKLSSQTDRYIAVSNALAEQLQQQIVRRTDKISIVYNGLAPTKQRISRTEARNLMKVPQNVAVIGTIARLIPEKGVADLLLAFRMLTNLGHEAYLVIIGDGPQKEELQELCSDLAARIRWLGSVEEASQLIPGFDLYVQSSHREGFGLAVLEAMREGVAVIATNVGGLPEVIGASRIGINECGALIPAQSPVMLCQYIQELLCDEERKLALGDAGKRRVQEYFSIDQMIQDTIRVYNEVLSVRRFHE